MKRSSVFGAAVIILCMLSGQGFAVTKKFGTAISLTTPTSLKAATSAYEQFKDKDILATGTVTKVCQKKGCWMMIKTDAEEVRVTFKDYGFFVPLGAAGQQVRLEGRLEKKEVSVEDQKHLLEDAGAPKAEIEAVKNTKIEYNFVAAGVEIG